jgi:hypothetical protein
MLRARRTEVDRLRLRADQKRSLHVVGKDRLRPK